MFCRVLSPCRDYDSLDPSDVAGNCQLAFDVASRDLGVAPVMTGEELAAARRPDKLTIVSYLTQLYEQFKKQRPPSGKHICKAGTF